MFTVLLSIYHLENPDYFHECMLSIWDNQSLKPSQIVLVEDGPLTDELYTIINFWKKKLNQVLEIVKLPENLGTGKAKNIGLLHCTYQLVCIADTDDICVSDRFEKQINFLKNNPEVTIVGGQIYEFITSLDNLISLRQVPLTHKEIVVFSQKQSPFNNVTIAYRKDHILAVGGYHHHLWMEDYNLFLRLISNGYKMCNLPDVLAYVRTDNGMYARRRGLKYIKSEKQLLDLKVQLKSSKTANAYLIFFARSFVRVAPISLLNILYDRFFRKKVN